jgi:hypothetical protein
MSAPLINETFDAHSGSLTNWYVAHNSYDTEVLADQPLGFWRLNETSGTTARGLMSNFVDGTYVGGVTLGTTGPMADGLTSVLLNGSTGQVTLNQPAAASTLLFPQMTSTTAISVEAWIKLNGAGGSLRNIVGTNVDGYSLAVTSTGKATFRIQRNSTGTVAAATSLFNVDDNVWHHLVGHYDGSTLTVWVDGASQITSVSDVIKYTGSTTAYVGGPSLGSVRWNGQVADVAIYDQVISSRVQTHYNAGIGIVGTDATPALATRHYDLRSFVNTNTNVPYTMNDLNYWNASSFNGLTMTQMNAGTAITTANESWVNLSGGALTIAADSSVRNRTVASAPVTVGTLTSFESTITDNIVNDFNVGGASYYINVALVDFPAQTDAQHLDLANSFIDFSSDAGYAAGKTDSIPFSSSARLLTGGSVALQGEVHIPTTLLVNCDLTALRHVRFRLQALGAAGSFVFKMQSICLSANDRFYKPIDLDTRRGVLRRTPPIQPETPKEWTVDAPPMFLRGSRAKNFTHWLKFNTGTPPAITDGSNKLSLLARYNESTGEFIKIELKTNTSESRLRIFEKYAEVFSTAASANTLANGTDYFMKVEANGNQVRASIYKSAGVYAGALIYTTNWQTVSSQEPGYVGLWFQPYHYDFTLDYMRSSGTQTASLESTVFKTLTPAMGLSITPKSSSEINLLDGVTLIASGDATLSSSVTIGNPTPSDRIQRTGVSWYGGLESSTLLPISSPKLLRISGDILVNTSVQGSYRVVLRDANGIVAFIRKIPVVTADKWVSFNFDVHGEFVPGDYKLMVQHIGFMGASFYLDNICVCQPTLLWEGSCDGGANWYPFGSAIGKQYSALNFPTKGNQLKLRASALDTTAWVQGYEIVPLYGYPGRT